MTPAQIAASRLTHLSALSGNENIHADLCTVINIDSQGKPSFTTDIAGQHKWAYLPFISIGIGIPSILLRTACIAYETIKTITIQQPISQGIYNIGRHTYLILREGIGMFPVLGNATVWLTDQLVIGLIHFKIKSEIRSDLPGSVYFYVNGQKILGSSEFDLDENFSFMIHCGARFRA